MEVGDEKNECKTNDALYGGKCNVQCGRDGVLPSGTGVFCGAVSGAGQRAGAARYDVHRNVCVYADGGSLDVPINRSPSKVGICHRISYGIDKLDFCIVRKILYGNISRD